MLNNEDIKKIKDILSDSLKEFYDTLILPYFEHNEKDHEEIKMILRNHEKILGNHEKILGNHEKLLIEYSKSFDSQDKELDSIQRKLEKNEDDHEEIFQKLDGINKLFANQEKRIRRVETVLSS